MAEQEKKKKMTMEQWIAIIVVMAILIVVLITVVSNLVFKLNQDYDGFAKDYKTVFQYYKMEDVQYENDIFKVFLSNDVYKNMSTDQKLEYCKNIYESTRNLMEKHKIIKPLEEVIVRFYSGGEKVADCVAGELSIYK